MCSVDDPKALEAMLDKIAAEGSKREFDTYMHLMETATIYPEEVRGGIPEQCRMLLTARDLAMGGAEILTAPVCAALAEWMEEEGPHRARSLIGIINKIGESRGVKHMWECWKQNVLPHLMVEAILTSPNTATARSALEGMGFSHTHIPKKPSVLREFIDKVIKDAPADTEVAAFCLAHAPAKERRAAIERLAIRRTSKNQPPPPPRHAVVEREAAVVVAHPPPRAVVIKQEPRTQNREEATLARMAATPLDLNAPKGGLPAREVNRLQLDIKAIIKGVPAGTWRTDPSMFEASLLDVMLRDHTPADALHNLGTGGARALKELQEEVPARGMTFATVLRAVKANGVHTKHLLEKDDGDSDSNISEDESPLALHAASESESVMLARFARTPLDLNKSKGGLPAQLADSVETAVDVALEAAPKSTWTTDATVYDLLLADILLRSKTPAAGLRELGTGGARALKELPAKGVNFTTVLKRVQANGVLARDFLKGEEQEAPSPPSQTTWYQTLFGRTNDDYD